MKPNTPLAPSTSAPRPLTRRAFLGQTALLAVAAAAADAPEPYVQTVLGPVPASKLGPTLTHEHVLCDFIGAEQTGRHRWDVDAVVERMQPFLAQLKERGITGFVDCTPAFIGRDPRVLRRLAQATGLHTLTNTGYYGGASDKFVPKHAYEESPDQLAARWIDEWKHGIEDTGVKPGFMKIGIDEIKKEATQLSAIDEKLVRAAARASQQTGLTAVCHTGGGPAGLVAAKLFIAQGAKPDRFVVAHADGHGLPINQQAADLGAWVSFDAVSRRPLAQHLALIQSMTENHPQRLLLSHDNGWYWVGQENGGKVRDFNYLSDALWPALREKGFAEALLRRLLVDNPAKALGLSGFNQA